MTAARGDESTLYVTDLDFTLLRSDGTLSPFTVDTINALLDRGVPFTYATARSFASAHRVTASLRLRLPVITYGGTITAAADDGRPRDIRHLPDGAMEAIREAADGVPTIEPVLLAHDDGRDWIRWNPDRETAGVRAFLDARAGDRRLRPITTADPLVDATVFYVSILGEHGLLRGMQDALTPVLPECATFLSIDHATPGLHWLELHHVAGTKARAIERLAARLGLARVVVFGDNHNDVPMFEIAHAGYAVANAVPELRAIATGTIGSNDDDGVAQWLSGAAGTCA